MPSGSGYGTGYGDGYGTGSGSGTGSGYGTGEGDGYGSGSGTGSGYGTGYGTGSGTAGLTTLPDLCGGYKTEASLKWHALKVGCEVHTLDDWIANAEVIDTAHGDGIADQTRALALKLQEEWTQ